MSLVLNFSVKSVDLNTLRFKETTGSYDSVNNTTGWGAPNISISDVSSALLTIERPDGGVYTIDLMATGLFPDDTKTKELLITNSDLGYQGNIEDGIYKFTYTVLDNSNNEYKQECMFVFILNLKCRFSKMIVESIGCSCDCLENESVLCNLINIDFLIRSLEYSIAIGDLDNISNSINKIKNILNNNCNNC
jgi:hypothetical protein